MQITDHTPLIAIAMLAARADGSVEPAEQRAIGAVVARVGTPDVTRLTEQVAAGELGVADLASRLSDDAARRAAYEGALAIVNADGSANAAEQAFLEELRSAGDAFTACLVVSLVEGRSREESLRRACAAGALAASRAGAQPSLPTAAAIDRILA